jgi:hypothetical protein
MLQQNWIISRIGLAVICGPLGGLYPTYYLMNVRRSRASAHTES